MLFETFKFLGLTQILPFLLDNHAPHQLNELFAIMLLSHNVIAHISVYGLPMSEKMYASQINTFLQKLLRLRLKKMFELGAVDEVKRFSKLCTQNI